MDGTGLRPVLSIKKAVFMDGEEGAGRSGGCGHAGSGGAGAQELRRGRSGGGQTRSAVSARQNAISSAGSISN